MFTKGNIPAYIMWGAATITSLIVYIYGSNVAIQAQTQASVNTIQTVDIPDLKTRVGNVEVQYKDIKDYMKEIKDQNFEIIKLLKN